MLAAVQSEIRTVQARRIEIEIQFQSDVGGGDGGLEPIGGGDFPQLAAAGTGPTAALEPNITADLKARVQARLPSDAKGRITYGAHANAIKGVTPR